ncbi:cupin domain-containing protein [Aspergillus mulundensis]|uniref:Cupin type-1 domain-containing protein n=1 Tax=Aspergillus mulundensis TaxID=1810919 RepID=A0A3D8RXW5_9EURO|nr:Uncharacterized protein DSM5745_05546 [Aspergillus mulundensis]RDW78694.1 Uncharacterized protein DSM5745_05546 [Aspergillus mulundensis]
MTTTSETKTFTIKPTPLIPNNPKPLLLYKNCFVRDDGKLDLARAYDTFTSNAWDVKWVTRYGRQQTSHYPPTTHEVMVVVSGPGVVRWGVADLRDPSNWEEHTYGSAFEQGGLEIEVEVGDVFLVPAGVAHKSFDKRSGQHDAVVLTGETAHAIELQEGQDERERVLGVEAEGELHGFVMMGAYPRGMNWTWGAGGDHVGRFEECWSVSNPETDPVVGKGKGGLYRYWA